MDDRTRRAWEAAVTPEAKLLLLALVADESGEGVDQAPGERRTIMDLAGLGPMRRDNAEAELRRAGLLDDDGRVTL